MLESYDVPRMLAIAHVGMDAANVHICIFHSLPLCKSRKEKIAVSCITGGEIAHTNLPGECNVLTSIRYGANWW
jgi:hypothetical protein